MILIESGPTDQLSLYNLSDTLAEIAWQLNAIISMTYLF